ncbi:MAG: DUF2142 domain-containing protein [Bacteroidetes bacterium]|nr:DUF2142 domain-containing protein [Bacteroidota bacterium]
MVQSELIIKRNHRFAIFICILAAVRVFVYASAFPFFNNTDEQVHFDLVMKYSQGHIPRSLETISPVTADYIVRYESKEFNDNPSNYPGQKFPPPIWKLPKENVQSYINEGVALWSSHYNENSLQAPLYYMVAGIWTKLGSLLGIKGGWLLYWIRDFNILLIMLLVWIAYRAASMLFPDDNFVIIGVPLMVALLPQDTFYSIQSDVLSPVCFGLAFIGMIHFMKADAPSPRQGIFAGLAIAATVFVKISNLPLFFIEILAIIYLVFRSWKSEQLKQTIKPILLFALCAIIPVVIWFLWNQNNYGDITASAEKVQRLGWTHKPFLKWFDHPIFTLHGAWTFWTGLMITFWRGEFTWWATSIGMQTMDIFYCFSSILFPFIAILSINKFKNENQRNMSWFSFWCFASLVFFMVTLSLSFDFGACRYPSKGVPYFYSGRLISAALIPFSLLFIQGIGHTLSLIKRENLRIIILILLFILISVSEIVVNSPAFSSQFNMFHM